MFHGEKPNLSNLRVFGARVYIHVPKGNRKNMEPASERGVFLGYEPNAKAYRVLRERDGRVIVSRDVMVDERGPSEVVELGSDPEKMDGSVEANRAGKTGTGGDEGVFPKGGDGEVALPLEEDGDTDFIVEEETADRRYPARARRAPGEWYRANVAVETGEHPKGSGEHPEPQTYQGAVGGEESELWKKSMDEEMRSLWENGTWELVEKPEGVKPVPMKWVYKIKRDAQGNVERYKSRLVAKGYLQRQGIDFEEVYAPVSKHTTLRALLAVVAERDLELISWTSRRRSSTVSSRRRFTCSSRRGTSRAGPKWFATSSALSTGCARRRVRGTCA